MSASDPKDGPTGSTPSQLRAGPAAPDAAGPAAGLAHRRAAAQLLPDRSRHRRPRHHHALFRLVVHQRHGRLDQAVRAQGLPARHLSAVRGAGLRPHRRHRGADADRRARRQPARPHAHLLRRADGRRHADRAQRLPRAEADLRIGHHRHRPGPGLPEGRAHRVSLQGPVVDRVRDGRDDGRGRRVAARRREPTC